MTQAATARLSLRDITKRYSAVVANDAVSIDVMPGEILALLGENGAGKSTLMKIAYGVVRPDRGVVAIDGVVVDVDSPHRARSLGISMVFQQFTLFDSLTVLENVALGLPGEPLAAIGVRLRALADAYSLDVDPSRYVHDLSVGEQQRVEILRALLSAPRILILDEPTSVLTPLAIGRLFDTLRKLAASGVSIVFISHKLHEIREIATRCVVMRAGKVVATVDPQAESEATLARMMLGAELTSAPGHAAHPGDITLRVEALSASDARGALHDASLEVRSGEIVGIAGISGNGQSTLMAALSGELTVDPRAVQLLGQPVGHLEAARRRRLGVRYIPEQRLQHAAVAAMTLTENVLLTGESMHSNGFVALETARTYATTIAERFDVRNGSPEKRADSLSGGNLQKFIVGRELLHAPRVLLIHQPTAGVDAGSAASIRNALIALRGSGCAVLLVSEDLDELYELCDRLYVIANGRLSPSVAPHALDVATMGRWMAGRWSTAPQSHRTAAEPA